MNLLDLPPELLTLCLSYLSGRQLALVSQTCRTVRDITNAEPVWQKRCCLEYQLKTVIDWGCTYKQLYSTVLYKYGPLFGLWRCYTTCYGGLCHAEYGSGCIIAYELSSTKDVRDPLKVTPAFKISIQDGVVVTECLLGHGDLPHHCDIHVEDSSDGGNFLAVVCQDPTKFHRHPLGLEHEYSLYQAECAVQGTYVDLASRKWKAYLQAEKCQTFMKLDNVPTHKVNVPIQPGFFKGMYGAHGTEILLLSYDDDKKEIHVRKITGDPNVPAGERSICADLTRPMILTEQQQESIALLRDIDIGELPCDPEQAGDGDGPLTRQPFVIPHDCDAREVSSLPNVCTHRYHSLGTVSPTGYKNPTQIVNHFIVFDEDTFAVLWLELYSMGVFSRVKEQFET